MDTKPYSIQSPKDIAMEYGGNKRKIAQAAQMGLLDPTSAVLAGMFIDRMRGAEAQEQAPQTSVAQQVLAPQPQAAPSAGLGATPEAQVLASAYPAPGAPPPIRTPEVAQPSPEMMAAEGGLMALPVPDDMYDYAGGGIIAFSTGSDKPIQGEGVVAERERERLRRAIQERAATITDPTARAKFLNDAAKMSTDEQRVALGEIELNAAPAGVVTGQKLDVSPAMNVKESEGEGFGNANRPSVGEGVVNAQKASAAVTSDRSRGVVFEQPPPPAVSTKGPVAAPAVTDKGPRVNTAEVAAAADPKKVDAVQLVAEDPNAKNALIKGGIPGLETYVEQYKTLLGQIPKGEGEKAYEQYLKDLPGKLDARKKEDLWTAVSQFGFNLAGSQSPYFLQAAGQAGAQTMPTVQEAIKAKRAGEEAAVKGRAELDKMSRAEQIKALEGGVGLYTKAQDREAQLDAARMAANKPTDMRSYVADYVQSARAAGDKDTPDAVLRQQGAEKYLNLYSASGARAQAALSQAGTAQQQAETNIQDRARDNVDKSLSGNWNSPENKKIRELQKQDRTNKKEGKETNLAGEYIQGLYSKEENRIRGAARPAPDAVPSPAPAPSAAPKPAAATAEIKSPSGKVIPAAAVAQLKAGDTPLARKQFDEVFGAGAAAKVLGK